MERVGPLDLTRLVGACCSRCSGPGSGSGRGGLAIARIGLFLLEFELKWFFKNHD